MTQTIGTSGRFEIIARLGKGAMGAVFHVLDRKVGSTVALKTVGRVDGDALLRFKREFRSLRDIRHPNLIELGELVEENGEWLYTMELLEGEDFLSFSRPGRQSAKPAPGPGPSKPIVAEGSPTDVTEVALPKGRADVRSEASDGALGTLSEPRLRSALAQLVEGVAALHAHGKVHRDLKPSNTLVTPDGRLVIFDLGLVTDVKDTGQQETDVGLMGTYAFMSPEQAVGAALDARSDWYSVGVMLFQALTGRLPFSGPALQTLQVRVHEDAPSPRDIVSDCPEDLDALCVALMARDREARPAAAEILARLGGSDPRAVRTGARTMQSSVVGKTTAPFVGREEELATLAKLERRTRDIGQTTVVVRGEAGIGKSALVSEFLDRLESEQPRSLVLRGRCTRDESVAYQAVDALLDGVSSHLLRMTDAEVETLVPPHLDLLVRTFPVLRRVAAFARPVRPQSLDPQVQRARLFQSVRSLFDGLARARDLAVLLEDVQWLDPDSRALLGEVLRPPAAPSVFLIATLQELASNELRERSLPGHVAATLSLGPLANDEARALTARLLERSADSVEELVGGIVREGQGHPLFLTELARSFEGTESGGLAHPNLDALVSRRLNALDEESRSLVRCASIAQQPSHPDALGSATGIEPGRVARSLQSLRVMRLLQTSGVAERLRVEPYHDRVRESVLHSMSDEERRALSRRMAEAYESLDQRDLAALAAHWADAGDAARAGRYMHEAADAAATALAFDRAATLYRRSLELDAGDDTVTQQRRIALAKALSNAGRSAEAAEVFGDAATFATSLEALDLRRRSAEQFVMNGNVDRGAEVFRHVLSGLNERFTSNAFLCFLFMVWNQIVVALHRRTRAESARTDSDPIERLRSDVLHSVAVAFMPVNTIVGVDFVTREHRHALEYPEAGRLARALGYAAVYKIADSSRGRAKAAPIFRSALELADRAQDPAIRGIVRYCQGLAAHVSGRWVSSSEHFAEAETIFRDECQEAPAELRTLGYADIYNLWERGQYRRLLEQCHRLAEEAKGRGEIWGHVFMRGIAMQFLGCVGGDPEPAHRDAKVAFELWASGFSTQHLAFAEANAFVRTYLGDPVPAFEEMQVTLPRFRRSMLSFVQQLRVRTHRIRGISALAAASTREPPAKALAEATRAARALAREKVPWADGHAHLLSAGIAAFRGRSDDALVHLESATQVFESADMAGYLAASRWQMGTILGGSEGDALRTRAERSLRAEGVAEPVRFVDMLAPGFTKRA